MLLVTGATGNFGSATVAAALAANVPFRAFVHSPAKAEGLRANGIDVAIGDLGDPTATAAALRGVSHLVLIGPSSPELVAVETQMIRAAREAGVQRVVKISAYSVGTKFQAGLGDLHAAAEAVLRDSGLEATVVRPAATMGTPLQVGWIDSGVLYAPCADGVAAYCAPADVAELAIHIATHGGHANKTYSVTGPAALDLTRVAAIISAETGQPLRYEANSDDEYAQRLDAAGRPKAVTALSISLFKRIRAGAFMEVLHTAETLLGRPATSYATWAKTNAMQLLRGAMKV